jgi:ABC-type glycerol-3-phosphate transport system permease component
MTAYRVLKWAVLTVAVMVSLFPFYWMLRTAVAPPDQSLVGGIQLWPSALDLSSFARAWTQGGLGAGNAQRAQRLLPRGYRGLLEAADPIIFKHGEKPHLL